MGLLLTDKKVRVVNFNLISSVTLKLNYSPRLELTAIKYLATWRHGPEYLQHVPDKPGQEEERGLPGHPDDEEDGGETPKDGGNDRAQQNDHDNVKMVFWFIRRNINIQFIQTVDL